MRVATHATPFKLITVIDRHANGREKNTGIENQDIGIVAIPCQDW